MREWLERIGVRTLFIEPGSPWENGYVESFNGKLRDELLNGEIFYTLKEAESLVQGWWREYNQVRPHSSLGYQPPAAGSDVVAAGCASLRRLQQSLVSTDSMSYEVAQTLGAGQFEKTGWLGRPGMPPRHGPVA